MARIADLVHESKLETSFYDAGCIYTIHTYDEPGITPQERTATKEQHWKRGERIGRGSYARVWLEQCVKGKREAELRAVKEIPNISKSIDYTRELEAIAKFSYPKYERCFVKSFGWYENNDAIFIAMEYFQHGDIQQYLSVSPPLPEPEAQVITFQLLEGLSFMHDNGFAHRDLKPGNILVRSKPPEIWWVKIGDFGISKRADNAHLDPSTLKGTPGFMAPELYGLGETGKGSTIHNAADMWSLGEIVFRILTKQPTFKDTELLRSYIQNPQTFPSATLNAQSVSNIAVDFVKSLMKPKPEERLTAGEGLFHNWVKSLTPTNSKSSIVVPTRQTVMLETTAPNNSELLSEPSATWSTNPMPTHPAAACNMEQASKSNSVRLGLAEVEAELRKLAQKDPRRLRWQVSIVDLLELLKLDSSRDARKQLAQKLNISVGKVGSPERNDALRKAVVNELAENGGKVAHSRLDPRWNVS